MAMNWQLAQMYWGIQLNSPWPLGNGVAQVVGESLGEGEGAWKDRVRESNINCILLEICHINTFVIDSGHAEYGKALLRLAK